MPALQRKCGVEVLGLRAGSKQDAAKLKAGEDAKQKSYRAVCRLSRAPAPERLTALNAMTVRVFQQRSSSWLHCVVAACAHSQVHPAGGRAGAADPGAGRKEACRPGPQPHRAHPALRHGPCELMELWCKGHLQAESQR